jgi:hypothetical protein
LAAKTVEAGWEAEVVNVIRSVTAIRAATVARSNVSVAMAVLIQAAAPPSSAT